MADLEDGSGSSEDDDAQDGGKGAMTMKAQLVALQQEDPATVFIVRRINKLGFQSPEYLKSYFESFGPVKQVHVSHSRVKANRQTGGDRSDAFWRQRPAALGFVVMESPSDTSRILEDSEHTIGGVQVLVQVFRRHDPAENGASDNNKGGNKARREKRRRPPPADGGDEDSPTCHGCGSTVAVNLGILACQVCVLLNWGGRAPVPHLSAPPAPPCAPPTHPGAPPTHSGAPPPVHLAPHPASSYASPPPGALHHAPLGAPPLGPPRGAW
mmetsp:Transcript_89749/g.253077  ORF Transcript_89749/g.253077 Transcript_89749/m.253077 type:complete len:269 (-) Transcript_89749:5-811(-)